MYFCGFFIICVVSFVLKLEQLVVKSVVMPIICGCCVATVPL
jgi:hypothetical protein